ncbi:MAG: enoyl-CoA hydratase/isomerase family protein, partial [Candidatus Marinimicrobia bacterium]|nr:enoyl-CoA hydratase/isomerase family protein [Candidatus Neomarinimicrobiota bacterium]
QGLDLIYSGKYKGMVLGHQNGNFSVGANLALILGYAENGEYDNLNNTSKLFQDIAQRIRFSPAPVVAVPFQFCFGGGFEITAPAAHRVASAETYIGAVEVGVGLIPGGGGNLRLLLNLFANAGKRPMSPFQTAQKAFETVGFAKVATSGEEAKHVGYFLKTDTIVLNSEHLIKVAKDKVLELADGYEPPTYRDDIKLPGAGGRTVLNLAIKGFKMQGKLSDHDEKIGQKLAFVLTGGNKAGLTKKVDEQYLLDIEREAFVSLAGELLSQARMKHMLKTGKPLRN